MFPGYLGYAVDGSGAQDRILRGVDPGSGRAENGDGAGTENLPDSQLPGSFQDVIEAVEVNIPGLLGKYFPGGREDGRQVVDDFDAVFLDQLTDFLASGDVQFSKGPEFFRAGEGRATSEAITFSSP